MHSFAERRDVVEGRDDSHVVRLVGRFDSVTVGAIRERLHTAVRDADGLLVVDLSRVDSIDATGLGVLVGTHRMAERAGRSMALRGTPQRLARLLRVTRLDRVLPTVPTPPGPSPSDAAAAGLSGPGAARSRSAA